MNPTKVYIVRASNGSYEDRFDWIHSVWFTRQEAEDSKAKMLVKYSEMGNAINPVGHDNYESMTEDDVEKYDLWQTNKWSAEEFNGADVFEYFIGEQP
jgi:hypothetical protein